MSYNLGGSTGLLFYFGRALVAGRYVRSTYPRSSAVGEAASLLDM
jgi:hypothetical protein